MESNPDPTPARGKTIVICCDGTGNEYGADNTNVVKLFALIQKIPHRQIAYYDPGVGTMAAPEAITQIKKWFTRLWGLAFAWGLTRNIEDAYEYLMDKYEEGDRVFLFGFSRGAFTVRALAGMLHRVGLLQKGSNNLIPYATRIYRRGTSDVQAGFKTTFSRPCKPHFVGVWDTVESVGLFLPRRFPDTKLNTDVQFGYHAISIDEKRSKFRPNLWDSPEDVQTIEQVWFGGWHSDVGGNPLIADIPLRWMIDKARDQGLLIREDTYERVLTNHLAEHHNALIPYWWILGWWARKIPRGAWIHESVFARRRDRPSYNPKNLREAEDPVVVPWTPRPTRAPAMGESVRSCRVYARELWNPTGIELRADAVYELRVDERDTHDWRDYYLARDPDGRDTWFHKLLTPFKRVPSAPTFRLIGTLGRSEQYRFRIGRRREDFRPAVDGELYCYANDIRGFYRNNHGHLIVTVTRTG